MEKHNEHSIIGWNEEVIHYYTIARSEFKFWKQNNMPRSGPVFHDMSIARARFKYALRQCRLDEQMIYSNRLANYMQCHDVSNFWKAINIRNNLNLRCPIVLLGRLVKLILPICGKITTVHY